MRTLRLLLQPASCARTGVGMAAGVDVHFLGCSGVFVSHGVAPGQCKRIYLVWQSAATAGS